MLPAPGQLFDNLPALLPQTVAMLWSCLLLYYREMAPAAPGAAFNTSEEEKSRALRLNLYVRTDDLAGPPLFEVVTTATSRAKTIEESQEMYKAKFSGRRTALD